MRKTQRLAEKASQISDMAELPRNPTTSYLYPKGMTSVVIQNNPTPCLWNNKGTGWLVQRAQMVQRIFSRHFYPHNLEYLGIRREQG